MKIASHILSIILILWAWHSLAGSVHGQSTEASGPVKAGGFNCSPAPCVLPPTQASEGGGIVTDSDIVSNPLSPKHLLLENSGTDRTFPGKWSRETRERPVCPRVLSWAVQQQRE
jgi:hypothetical protein